MHSNIPMHNADSELSVVRKSLSGRLNIRGKNGQSFSTQRSANWLSVTTAGQHAFPAQQVRERQLSLCIGPCIWLALTRRLGCVPKTSPRPSRTLFGAICGVSPLGAKTPLKDAQRASLLSIFEDVRSRLRSKGVITYSGMFNRLASH